MLKDKEYIYFDNAATSFPKPDSVVAAVVKYLTEIGANPGRSGHKLAVEAGRIVFKARNAVAKFFNVKNPMHVIFTANATDALNLAINGVLKDHCHVITTSMEHNSTIRPLKERQMKGDIELTIVQCETNGLVDLNKLEDAITDSTKVMVINHASNVLGSIQPIRKIGNICKKHNVILIADCAQSAGIIPINLQTDMIDILCFAGHKGLYGPTGTGGMVIADHFDYKKIKSLKQGGTGSLSDQPIQPDFLPDIFESGTLNVAGIAGLLEGVNFINDYPGGLEEIAKHKMYLKEHFIKQAQQNVKDFISYSKLGQPSTGVVAFNLKEKSVSDIAQQLSDNYNIMCRPGLHCAPLAHQTIKTFPDGTLRFGFSLFNTVEEIEKSINALKQLAVMKYCN